MSREQPNLAFVLRQRNFEKLPVTLSYDDRRVRRFTPSRQFKRDPLGMLQCQGGIGKHLANFVPECGGFGPEMKVVARHSSDCEEVQAAQMTTNRASKSPTWGVRLRNGVLTAMAQFGSCEVSETAGCYHVAAQ